MKKFLSFLFFIFSFNSIYSQDVLFSFNLEPQYKIIQRADYSKRVNGSYLGYVNREIRGIMEAERDNHGIYSVSGDFYLMQEIKKEGYAMAMPIDTISRSNFRMDVLGNISNVDGDFPIVRNFPVFPNQAVDIGDRWEAPMSIMIQNPETGEWAEIPQYCGYHFKDDGYYDGRYVYYIEAQYAVRYRSGANYIADQFLDDSTGSHRVVLTIDAETLSPIIMRDTFDETFFYKDGGSIQRKGFNLVFYDGISGMDRDGLLDDLYDQLRDLDTTIVTNEEVEDDYSNVDELTWSDDITMYKSDDGVTLSLNNLHFEPDRAVILREDMALLDRIAEQLRMVENRTFLVKGHTANIGSYESQMVLSQQRAKAIVDELVIRGIDAGRFIYVGMAGDYPIATNDTEDGRKLNRRVEILIMED